jgi:perosamine synthetase
MSRSLTRRKFIAGAATAGAVLSSGVGPVRAAETSAKGASAAKSARAKGAAEWPMWEANDEQALLDVLRSGKWGRAGGTRVKEFEKAYADLTGAKFCLATSSGTGALLTALGALDIGPGDEVVLPPYTFVATFNAITHYYALPVFADTDAATFQIDPKKVSAAITSATKLLLPVHIGGAPCDVDAIVAAAKAKKLPVLEDACQAWTAQVRGANVGTRGLAGCFSFQSSKNLTAGEGGAIITNDEAFVDRCANFHSPSGGKAGTPSSGRGGNYRLTEFQAALLLAQMARLRQQQELRDQNATYLSSLLKKIPGITPAKFGDGGTRSAWHLYMFRYDSRQFANLPRAKFLQALGQEGVQAGSGYTPLNTSAHVKALAANPHYQRIYGKDTMARWVDRNQCPVNDRVCEEAAWFGQTKLLGTRADMEKIAEVIASVQKRAGDLAKV